MGDPYDREVARPSISPGAYRRLTPGALLLLAAIVVSGAAVRLTGSGLGCPDWPNCEKGRLVAPLEKHALVEFTNRTITGLVSVAVILAVLGSMWRVPRRRDLIWLSWGLVAGVLALGYLGYDAWNTSGRLQLARFASTCTRRSRAPRRTATEELIAQDVATAVWVLVGRRCSCSSPARS
jgi:hypothetical protein